MQQQAFLCAFQICQSSGLYLDPLLLEIDYPLIESRTFNSLMKSSSAMKSKLSRFGLSAPEAYLTPWLPDITDDVGNVVEFISETKSLSLLIQTLSWWSIYSKLHRLTPLSVTQFITQSIPITDQ